MTYLVKVLPEAHADAVAIINWLRERSPQGALNWAKSYDAMLLALANQPERRALAPEAKRLRQPVRQAFFKTDHGHRYRMVYLVVEDEVRVLRIRAPGQKPLRRGDIE